MTAIVGGGIAGIACALELMQAGREVVLLEAAKQLGGRARGVEWQGLTIDNGQHLMIGAYCETLRLFARLDTSALLEKRPLRLIMPGFSLSLPRLPAPLHLAAGLLFAHGLSLREKWAAMRFMRGLQVRGFRLPADTTVAELVQGQPQRVIDRLWAPICIAALNTPAAIASAQVFCNVLRDSLAGRRAKSDFLFNRADYGRILDKAARAKLGERLRLASKVTAVTRTAQGFHLAGAEIEVESVVLAVHPARLPALLLGLPELAHVRERVGGYGWQPILTLWLRFAAPVSLPYPMLGLAPGEAPWAFERNDIAPGVVSIVMSADGPHLQRPPESLRDEYLDMLKRAVGPLPELLDWTCITEKRATWSCTPDLFRPENATALAGLYLAGDYTAGDYPATLEAAVGSGVKSARLILQSPNRP